MYIILGNWNVKLKYTEASGQNPKAVAKSSNRGKNCKNMSRGL